MNNDDLLTEAAKILKIKAILPAHSRRGRFFIPDESFYTPPQDNMGLRSMAKQLSMWIGFKPIALEISFASDIPKASVLQTGANGHVQLFIHNRYRHNPYTCAALLSERLLQYYVEYRKKIVLADPREQRTICMLGVVYSGLGIVVFNDGPSYWQQLYPKLYEFIRHKLRVKDSKIGHYRDMLTIFAADYRLDLADVTRYLCPWAPQLSKKTSRERPSQYVTIARFRSRQAYTALVTSFLVVSFGMGASGYLLSQRPEGLSATLQQEQEEIAIIKTSYDLCNKTVDEKQHAYNQSDFFLQRAVDADRARCESLRNLYNYHVDQFSQQTKH